MILLLHLTVIRLLGLTDHVFMAGHAVMTVLTVFQPSRHKLRYSGIAQADCYFHRQWRMLRRGAIMNAFRVSRVFLSLLPLIAFPSWTYAQTTANQTDAQALQQQVDTLKTQIADLVSYLKTL